MDCIRRAAYLNSNGVSLLLDGDHQKAFKSFRESLKSLNQATAHIADVIEAPAALEPSAASIMARPIPRRRMDGGVTMPGPDENGKPYLYDRGLVFYPSSGTLSTIDVAFYSAVVTFNLVLTYHKRQAFPQERDLTKMMSLYETCLKLVGECIKAQKYDCRILMVAALNNKAVIHSELGDIAGSRRALYHVWDVMKYPHRRPADFEAWEIEGFFLNIYLLLVNAPFVASAA